MISRDSLKGITSVIAVGLAIFQIYFTAGFGIIDSQLLRAIHLGIVLALVFLYFPPQEASGRRAGTPRLAGGRYFSKGTPYSGTGSGAGPRQCGHPAAQRGGLWL